MLTKSARSVIAMVIGAALVLPMAATASAAPVRPSTPPLIRVTPTTETPGIYDDAAGGKGDADDPAIWVNHRNPARSIVVGTAKNAGLRVYDLQGRVLQSVPTPSSAGRPSTDAVSRFNNVSIVRGFRLGGRTVDLAVTTDRGRDQLRSYVIDPTTRTLRDVTTANPSFVFSADPAEVNEQTTAYGLATYSDNGHSYAVATRRNRTDVAILELVADATGAVGYRKVDTIAFPKTFTLPNGSTWSPCEDPGADAQLEGLVVDSDTHSLYAAQEDIGLWRVPLRGGTAGVPRSVERTKEFGVPATYDAATDECTVTGKDPGFGGRIAADTEGLTIYRTGPLSGSLLVSSQGDNTFYTYDRVFNRPIKHFAVVDGPRADGSSDCDGADTVATPLPGYPHGLLVVQDGTNTPDEVGADGSVRVNTNFKFLDAAVLGR